MKTVKHLLLTNWHYFSHEFLDFGQINFLTGKTGSGKTTIIDALQLLMLGDTTGHFFNKSASDKSTRSLKGYLRCEIGDQDDGTPLYLRNGRFTSYVALEFEDDVTNIPFVIGVVFDIFDDGSYDWKFFSYDGTIPADHFIIDRIPQHYKDLSQRLMSEYKNVKFFQVNQDYREFLKVRLGNLSNSFFQLFKRAIPFSPISNIEQFITEYVCDVENTINVDKMQESFRNYKKLEIEVTALVKRSNILSEIIEKYNNWQEKQDGISLKKYIVDRCELHLANKEEQDIQLKIEDLKSDNKENQEILDQCNKLMEEAKKNRERMMEEKFQSDVYKRKAVYQEKYDQLSSRIDELQGKVSTVEHNILNYIDLWQGSVEDFINQVIYEENKAIVDSGKTLLSQLETLKKNVENSEVNNEILSSVFASMNEFQGLVKKQQFSLLDEDSTLNAKIDDLNLEIQKLSQGKKSYDYKLVEFKAYIEEGLRNRYGKDVEVNFLADLLDIKDESWRKSIETYLNTQRFYLIVEPKYVEDAIKIYDGIKHNLQGNDFGIVDTEKVIANVKEPLPHALSEELITKNEGARAFVNMILGNLIKCRDIKELRKYTKSITKDGMLYQNYVARALNINRTQSYIGSGASAKLIEEKKQEIIDIKYRLNDVSETVYYLGKLTSLEGFNTNEIRNISNVYEDAKSLPSLLREADSTKQMLKSLSDNFLEALEKGIAEIDVQIKDLEDEKNDINTTMIKNNYGIEKYTREELPAIKTRILSIKERITSINTKEFITTTGEPFFLDLVRDGKDLSVVYSSYKNEIEATIQSLNNLWRSIVDQRTRYNTIYELNYDSHALNNNDYQKEYDELVKIALVEYTDKIKEAKSNAMKEFRNDFLSKLKSNFDTVISQISQLNDALNIVQFGEDSYKFSVTPRPEYKEYYEMINDPLLLSGIDIEGEEFLKKHEDTVESLFRQITFVDSETDNDIRSELEKNIEKFTDFRSYLKFDLMVTNREGKVQRLSRTLLHKSGGETQTPFYISILASFAQNYRLYLSNDKNSSIRLVVFDEAFSKMDSERIQESIKLLRAFGLQALVCCPSDKIQEITPLSDNTICVVRKNTTSTVKQFFEVK